jgi:carboxymethylenebutenolidase
VLRFHNAGVGDGAQNFIRSNKHPFRGTETMAAYEGMIAEMINISGHNGDTISAYTARPMGPGPFPCVVLIHHLPGWDEIYREWTRRLAHYGYAAISHNLYERVGEGKAEDVAAKARAEGGVSDDQMVGDTQAAENWIRMQPYSNGKVGVIGSCSGGRQAFLYACQTDTIDCCVELWGGRVVQAEDDRPEKQPVQPLDMTSGLSCPLLGIFGNEDRAPSADQVDLHEAELKKHGKDYEFHRYDDAGHGIFYYYTPLYRVAQAKDGWDKVFAFFQKNLAG